MTGQRSLRGRGSRKGLQRAPTNTMLFSDYHLAKLNPNCHMNYSIIFTEISFSPNPYLMQMFFHVPGLSLLGFGGAPYNGHTVMARKPYFTFSTSSLKQPAGGASYYARRLLKPRPIYFVQIMVKLYLQAFWQNFEYGKIGLCLPDL